MSNVAPLLIIFGLVGAAVPFFPALNLLAFLGASVLLIRSGPRALAGALLVAAPFMYLVGPASRFILMGAVGIALLKLPDFKPSCSMLSPIVLLGVFTLGRVVIGGGMPMSEAVGSAARLWAPLMLGLVAPHLWDMRKDGNRLGLLVLGLPLCFTATQLVLGLPSYNYSDGGRLTGGLSVSSALGVLGALAFACLIPSARNGRPAALLAAGAAVAVLASGTRIAILAVALCFFIYAVAPKFVSAKVRAKTRNRALAVGMVALVAIPFAFPVAWERTTKAFSEGGSSFASGSTDNSIGIRKVLWEIQSDFRGEQPLFKKVFGSGAGMSERIVRTHFRGRVSLPHSEYQHLLTDYGYVGLLLYVMALLQIGWWSLKRFASTGEGLAGALIALTFALLSLTDNPLFYAHAMFLPFVVLGCQRRTQPTDLMVSPAMATA